ncbi:hypothetical protein ACPOL_5110 [Acidisarcina polymorpha]|uniref:Uncharacterized protein n=1 Tax=Acidisarcina polymorpha TaxID=2211140 RepID=A0A2Z5G734_9BACT|nr:hypothetical protein ACPOL_5110 [Acidisarcina polymorpha]
MAWHFPRLNHFPPKIPALQGTLQTGRIVTPQESELEQSIKDSNGREMAYWRI